MRTVMWTMLAQTCWLAGCGAAGEVTGATGFLGDIDSETGAASASVAPSFDVVQLYAPSATPKVLYVFGEQPDGNKFAKACVVTYSLDASGKLSASWRMLYDDPATPNKNEVKVAFDTADKAISTWNASVQLCSDTLSVTTQGQDLLLSSPPARPDGKKAHVLKLSASGISMLEKSTEVMAQVFGGTVAFRKPTAVEASDLGLKLNQYITVKFPTRLALQDYSALDFYLDATPVALNVNTRCVPELPPPPYDEHAQLCYDPKKHASQFRMALGNVTWTDPSCTKRIEGDPVCGYYGDFLYMTMQLHDERHEFLDGDFFLDPGTQAYIYRVDLRRFLPPGTTQNPYKIVGQRTAVGGDLLPLLRDALIEAEAMGYVPPRRTINGALETDEQYLAHYSLTSANLGYEVSGLSGLHFQTHAFRLVAVLSGTHEPLEAR